MVQLSEQIQNKLNVANKVISSAQTHGPAVASILAERAKEVQGPNTKASSGAFTAVIDAIADILAAANTATQDAELKYYAEKADDLPVRAARDAAVTDVAATLGQIRGGLEGTLGAAAAPQYGLSGEIPRTPHKLVAFTRNVLKNLQENPQNVTTALGSSFNTAKAAAVLQAKLDELSGHVEADNREARELEQALTARDRAAEAWNDAYQGAATTLEGLYRAAGYRELAGRVRPTQRKIRGEDPGEEIDGATGTQEEPNGG